MTSRFTILFATLLGACCTSGCAMFDVPFVHHVPEASARNPVMRIVCLWEPAEGRDPNGMPCRGFAGQVLFLGNKGGTPVKVNGEVKAYVFDDLGTPEDQGAPVHVFNFNGPAWGRHLQVGTFGPTYHVFIPYTRKGGIEANCAVRLRYTAENGSVVDSDSNEIHLRGKARSIATGLEPGPMEFAPQIPEVRTTTIPLDQRAEQPAYTPVDSQRAEKLLQQFLMKHTQELQQRDENQSSTNSDRIHWDGRRVEVLDREAPRQAQREEPAVPTTRISPAHPLFNADSPADDLNGQTTSVEP